MERGLGRASVGGFDINAGEALRRRALEQRPEALRCQAGSELEKVFQRGRGQGEGPEAGMSGGVKDLARGW